jgi:hypothetical protein
MGAGMNPTEIAKLLLDLMTGQKCEPKEGVEITCPRNMKFEVRGETPERVVITWDPSALVNIKASKWGFGVNGKLTGIIVTPGKLQALISGPIPDVTLDLTKL